MTAEAGSRKKSSKAFHEKLRDGGQTPAGLLLDRMRGEDTPEDEKVAIAKHLTQYELPRLNAIEADVTTAERTHEEWLDRLGSDLTDEDLAEAGNDNDDDYHDEEQAKSGTDDG